jgi:hypothetical protein
VHGDLRMTSEQSFMSLFVTPVYNYPPAYWGRFSPSGLVQSRPGEFSPDPDKGGLVRARSINYSDCIGLNLDEPGLD